jgi:hypothetical protein
MASPPGFAFKFRATIVFPAAGPNGAHDAPAPSLLQWQIQIVAIAT